MPKLILNRIRTPDGTILTSRSRNDYVVYIDANGIRYSIDGGLDYLKRQTLGEYDELSKYDFNKTETYKAAYNSKLAVFRCPHRDRFRK